MVTKLILSEAVLPWSYKGSINRWAWTPQKYRQKFSSKHSLFKDIRKKKKRVVERLVADHGPDIVTRSSSHPSNPNTQRHQQLNHLTMKQFCSVAPLSPSHQPPSSTVLFTTDHKVNCLFQRQEELKLLIMQSLEQTNCPLRLTTWIHHSFYLNWKLWMQWSSNFKELVH